MGMMALNMAGQVMGHQAEGKAVKGRNQAKLKNFEIENEQYKTDVLFNNAAWKNDVLISDVKDDQVYQSMVTQWSEQDAQVDQLFAEGDKKIEKAIIEMYENDYAGTQTGRTAARRAQQGAKKLGQYKSEVLASKLLARDQTERRKEGIRQDATSKSRNLYENIRRSPIHGPTPMAPELERMPGKGGLILGLAQSALTGAVNADVFTAKDIGEKVKTTSTGEKYTSKIDPTFGHEIRTFL